MMIDSPCVNCKRYAECNKTCVKWYEWFRETWPIVTGQRKVKGNATD